MFSKGKARGGGARGGGGGQRGHSRKSKQPLGQINVNNNERQRLFSDCSENQCSVCWNDIEIFALGHCNHPVCHVCSTRMRVLCSQKDCAICRQDLSKVVFVRKVCPYEHVADQVLLQDKKFQICFEDQDVKKSFDKLLSNACPLCPAEKTFNTFKQLDTHLRREHEKFFCELCNQHLKAFAFERKFYSRAELATHRRKGDPDDSSHRGHPLCQFCDVRFVDDEELFRHLRRDHYFCHFCDADGVQAYYPDYGLLKEHFKNAHYLCEEGDCVDEQFTHAFRTELDLKAHRLEKHKLSKAENKLNRQVGIDVSFVSRRPNHSSNHNHNRGHGHGILDEENQAADRVPDMAEDFPTLNGATSRPTAGGSQSSKSSGNMANRLASSSGRNWAAASHTTAAFHDTDFPSLPGASTSAAPLPPRVNQGNHKKKVPPKSGPTNPNEDFPSLPPSAQNQVHAFGPQYRYPSGHTPAWQNEASTGSTKQRGGKKVAPAPDLDFPSLGQPSKPPSGSKTEKKSKSTAPSKKNSTLAERSSPPPPSTSSLRSAADLIFNGGSSSRGSSASSEMKENVPKVNVVKELPVQPKSAKPPPGFANRNFDHSQSKKPPPPSPAIHSKNYVRPSDFNERNAKLMSGTGIFY